MTGDQVAIAKETARVLGIGGNILNAAGLPVLGKGNTVPPDLDNYARSIIEADGFAQARCPSF